MVSKKYIPKRCDIVWLDFSLQAGFEQAGRRPALVLSSKAYNEKTNRFIVCPITSKIKGYVFEMVLPNTLTKIQGAVLIDHVKNMDWTARNVEFCTSVDVQFTDSVADIIDGLVH
jgi:mRNA interferase MazF